MSSFYIHPEALVETEDIGHGTRIWAFAHVMGNVTIGRDCNIGDHCFIESNVVIGDNVTIKNGVCIWEGIVLHDDVFIGPNAVFTNDLLPRSPRMACAKAKYESKKWLRYTFIEKGATIGANATILCHVSIGQYAMVGAGSVVTKSVPSYSLVYGNPAEHRGYVCRCGQVIEFVEARATCVTCGLRYGRRDEQVVLEA